MEAVIFALCCLCCSALNDFVFKLFADRPMSRGMFFFIIGLIWFAVLAALTDWSVIAKDPMPTVTWGLISGLFSIVSNILLIEAMGKLSAGISSAIFRLNLVFVVPGAMLLFGERLSGLQWLGIAAAISAIILFSRDNFKSGEKASAVGLVLILSASLLRAIMGLSYKYGFIMGADDNGLVTFSAILWIAGGPLYARLKDGKIKMPSPDTWKFGAVSGLFVIGIVYFMAQALKHGGAGIVLSIAQMSFLVTLLLSVIFLKEKLTAFKSAGLVCGLAAILLLSMK